jgi:hypothetical protein
LPFFPVRLPTVTVEPDQRVERMRAGKVFAVIE